MKQVPVERFLQQLASPEAFAAYRECLRYIHRQGFHAGDRLPPQSELYKKLKICQGTLSKAFEWLVEDGVLTRKRRVGTYLLETYPRKPVPPIWSVGLAFPMFEGNPTWPRLAYELHRFLVRYQCRDRIYMVSPRANGVHRIGHRGFGDFTGLAEDAAMGAVDAVIAQTRIDAPNVPVCYVVGPEDAQFGVVCESSAMAGEAATGLIRGGCRRLGLVLTGIPRGGMMGKVWRIFQRTLGDCGLPCPQDRLLVAGHGREAGIRLADHLLSLPEGERPDGLVVMDDHVASGLTAGLRARGDYRPALAVQVNRQTPEEFLLPVVRYENDLALLARLTVEKLVEWLLDPERPQTVLKVPPRLLDAAENVPHRPLP
jgi:hypothetical protein